VSETPEPQAVVGTDALGRPFTDAEKRRFGALLRAHDYPGAHLTALRFAAKLGRSPQHARDLVGRAELRLMRSGWNASKVSLVGALCRLVWSEWTHAIEEMETARRAEEGFLRELGPDSHSGPMPDARLHASDRQRKEEEALEDLRCSFERAGDEVNLAWLRYTREGIEDLQEMADRSETPVREFYLAADRRKRHVRRLLAARGGVTLEDE